MHVIISLSRFPSSVAPRQLFFECSFLPALNAVPTLTTQEKRAPKNPSSSHVFYIRIEINEIHFEPTPPPPWLDDIDLAPRSPTDRKGVQHLHTHGPG
jgi:hypothetical protein